ncbi:MAG: D-alanine--D-alanine ligase [Ghiorsea sp.]
MKLLNNQRIAVLMGGCSSEREISLRSGQAVFEALQSKGLEVLAVDLSGDSKTWQAQIEQSNADLVFIALHGTYGEDGCIQGLLETMNIPYTGSDVLSSALCMNKKLSKVVMEAEGIITPQSAILKDGAPASYPVFVKPVAEGSSVGLHYVENEAAWSVLDLQNDAYWLVEACVTGVEVAVGVLNGKALPPVEVAPKSGMYDFASKYTAGATNYYCPARLTKEKIKQCMSIAEKSVVVLGCKGAPRVDLIVPSAGSPVVLEVNTIPGMTATSLLPKAAAEVGVDFPALCVAILESVDLGGET